MTIDQFTLITKALSDPNRVRALMALRDGELCVCQIIELLNLAPSTVSKHMSILRQAGLVEGRKEERWMYYRLPAKGNKSSMTLYAFDWIFDALGDDETIAADRKIVGKIMRKDPSCLCKRQRER